ncbi:cation:proton antiporter subunit C [Crenalkalicoccus roseus]|uniref:cation:proton antiporter subunit C n=1 Tax=Crenalkalicoccus roseus TaxID=1485588 RepID=UPI001080F7CD|nr:cation:proton antiporter subunit C [Crenalkalicoccus roseus]
MTATLYGLTGAALVGIGLYGLIVRRHALRRLLAFNLLGSGVFLLFGAVAERAGPGGDPVPHAMIITGIVVALAATALGVALVLHLARETGRAEPDPPEG